MWCQTENQIIETISGSNKKKSHEKRMRCPKCKKRFFTFVRECKQTGEVHVYFPKHKIKKQSKSTSK